MPRRFIISMIGLALALLLTPQVSLAVDEHISQAIEYTKLAIDDGKYWTGRWPSYTCRGGARARGSQ